jgi:hypothetical protein
MKTKLALFLLLFTSASVAQIGVHPKLFFSAADSSTIRTRINQPNSDAQALWKELSAQVNWYIANPRLFVLPNPKYRFYENIPALAFSYFVTRNAAHRDTAKYLVFNTNTNPDLQGIIHDNVTDPFGIGFRINALSLVYDFMFEALDSTEREQIRLTIISDLNESGLMREYLESPAAGIQNNHLIHHALPVLLGALSIYGEHPNYTTAEADSDIARAKRLVLTSPTSYLKRMWSASNGAYVEGVHYNFVAINQLIQFIRLLERREGTDFFGQSYIGNRLSKNLDWLAYELLSEPMAK